MEPRLIPVETTLKRANQGWCYLAGADAPHELAALDGGSDVLPP